MKENKWNPRCGLPFLDHTKYAHDQITVKHIVVFHATAKSLDARCAELNDTTESCRDEYSCLSLHIKRTLRVLTALILLWHFDPASHLNVARATSTAGLLKIIIISRAVDIMNCDNALPAPCPTVKMFYYMGGYSHWNFNKSKSDKNDKRAARDHTGSFQLSLEWNDIVIAWGVSVSS